MNEIFKLANSETVSLVHHIDLSWNQIEGSLCLMYEKLIQLGFVNNDGQIEIIEPKTEKSRHHV